MGGYDGMTDADWEEEATDTEPWNVRQGQEVWDTLQNEFNFSYAQISSETTKSCLGTASL